MICVVIVFKNSNNIDSWTRTGGNTNNYTETILFEGNATSGEIILANGHTYDEFDVLKFLYGEELNANSNKFRMFTTQEFLKSDIDYILNNYDTSRTDIFGLYGYDDAMIELNIIENKNKFTIVGNRRNHLLRITGIKY